ncbi:hypothetical protein [Chitinophaga sp.]|uniref:hypothetical protein n=2 Tax=Chitinophaga TaxID=79328 RepID=UPI002FDEA586
MRILTLLIFTASMAVSARPLAQTVTLKAKNLPLEKIFPVVKAQTGYVFFSYGNLLQKSKAVTLDADQVPLQQFLAMVFRSP